MTVTVECWGCGVIFEYEKKLGPGRIRRHCAKDCAKDHHLRTKREKRQRKSLRAKLLAGSHLCGCGKDYFEVEINHRCENPLPVLDS